MTQGVGVADRACLSARIATDSCIKANARRLGLNNTCPGAQGGNTQTGPEAAMQTEHTARSYTAPPTRKHTRDAIALRAINCARA
eukprot:4834177-Alexandrium_andersonii.AAC.1